ncbi:hypothetical protein JTE90_008849 [Oedothorax gibbosus]|uniref:Uncharacterized protein n=1 Tax=Oedothorax gibbosus TaxID=931172 RepID=A0AAV6U2I8_9ARAC|nr:hypothetical protein JTE90_008849 [Oedothorax gibbosus]
MFFQWLIILVIFSNLKILIAGHSSKFANEKKFMQCLCTSSVPERLQKIQCMDAYVPPSSAFRFPQTVQYCGYFAYKTNFGQTMRQGANIPDYNPWEYAPDLNTDRSCSHTRYLPGQRAPVHIQLVTSRGWVISKCILDMARVQGKNGQTAKQMLQACCWN